MDEFFEQAMQDEHCGALMRKDWHRARLPSLHIYAIENTVTGKIYVGSTTIAGRRFSGHDYQLRSGIHPNKELQADWEKYGGAKKFLSHPLTPSIPGVRVGTYPQEETPHGYHSRNRSRIRRTKS